MQENDFEQAVKRLSGRDPRYKGPAYFFVKDALAYTAKALEKPVEEVPERHVSAAELLEGIKSYTLQEFGPISMRILNSWGISRTEDFGEIVYNLIKAGWLKRSDKDSKEDFAEGYDFYSAFAKPFKPAHGPDDGTAGSRPRADPARSRGKRNKPGDQHR
ncbi:MAG: hypothetical protein R6V03_07645 [Kiritimatiellia bacterium]